MSLHFTPLTFTTLSCPTSIKSFCLPGFFLHKNKLSAHLKEKVIKSSKIEKEKIGKTTNLQEVNTKQDSTESQSSLGVLSNDYIVSPIMILLCKEMKNKFY